MLIMGPATVQAAPWWQSSINVESKVGTDRSIQSLDIMYPLSHSNSSLTFTDLRGRVDDDDSVEVNLGLAHRFVAEEPLGLTDEAVLGYYGFADRLESRFDNTFYQGTIGAEYFTKNYSFRVNGYLPEDERKPTTTFTQLQATGTQIFFEDRVNYERPLPGFDVELGKTIRFDGWQAYGRGGYFRFHHSDVAEIEGERFRAGLQFDGSTLTSFLPDESQFTIGAEWQRDDVREEQSFGLFRVRVPFGSSVVSRGSGVESQNTNKDRKSNIEEKVNGGTTSKEDKSSSSIGEDIDGGEPDSRLQTHDSGLKSWQKDRLTERIKRDVDVVTGGSDRSEVTDTDPAQLAGTGETIMSAAVAREGASGPGTFNNPGTLASAVNAAGTDGTVFVQGDLTTDGVLVPGGQRLVNGRRIMLQSPGGQHTAVLGSTDTSATIEGTAPKQSILQLATGTSGQTIRDLTLISGKHAIKGENVDGLTIENVTVTATDSDAIELNAADNASIENSTIEGTLDAGNDFGGKVTTSQVDQLRIGRNATGQVSGVTVTDGNFTIGNGVGRGNGNRFVLDTVEVKKGDLFIGAAASNNNGSFTMRQVQAGGTVTIDPSAGEHGGSFTMDGVSSEGGLEVGSSAGAHSGSFTMTDVSSEGTLEIGDNAGRRNGSFTADNLSVDSGDVSLGTNFGKNGTGRIEHSSVSGNLEFGNNFSGTVASSQVGHLTIGDSATGRIEDVTVRSGDLTVGDDAGTVADRQFVIQEVEVLTGDVEIGDDAGRNNGTFRMTDVSLDSGSLSVGDNAGRTGSFEMSGVTVQEKLSVGDDAGSDGSFVMKDVNTIAGNVTVGAGAGASNGSFTMTTVATGDSLSIGPFAGGDDGFANLTDVTTGGRLSIGNDAGQTGSFSIVDTTIDTGNLVIGNGAGSEDGNFTMDTVAVNNGYINIGDRAGGPAAPATPGGHFEMNHLTVSDSLSIGDEAGRGDLTAGTFSMTDIDVGTDLSIGDEAGKEGTVEMIDVIVEDDLSIGQEAGNAGSFTMKDVEALSGDVTVGNNAGSFNGSFSMKTVYAGDSLSIGEGAGGFGGSVILTDVTTGDSLTVGDYAGEEGLFEIQSSQVGSNLDIGQSFAVGTGGNRDAGFVRNTTIEGSLKIGIEAAFHGSSRVGILNNTVKEDFLLGRNAATNGEIYIRDNVIYKNITINSSPGNFFCSNNLPSPSCP